MTLSRRDFIKLAGLGAGAMAFRSFNGILPTFPFDDFPKGDRLGRALATLDYRTSPRIDYPPQTKVYPDQVVQILREVVASSKDFKSD